jgi:hypothetical protein
MLRDPRLGHCDARHAQPKGNRFSRTAEIRRLQAGTTTSALAGAIDSLLGIGAIRDAELTIEQPF